MNLVVDSNIVISALIKPPGVIAKVLFNQLGQHQLFGPTYLFDEVIRHKHKILNITGYSESEFQELLYNLLKRLHLIDDSLIYDINFKRAFKLVNRIDPKDIVYVALSLQMQCHLWTGDKKLYIGLKDAGFTNVLSTNDLILLIQNQ